jgi:hypothetical protein
MVLHRWSLINNKPVSLCGKIITGQRQHTINDCRDKMTHQKQTHRLNNFASNFQFNTHGQPVFVDSLVEKNISLARYIPYIGTNDLRQLPMLGDKIIK